MNIDQIIVAILSGVAVSTLLPGIKEQVAPVAENAWKWQENTVRVAELMGSSAAVPARQELEANRPGFRKNLDDLARIPSEP